MLSSGIGFLQSRFHFMLPLIACASAWAGSAATSFAIIGDSRDDLSKRYGAGKEIGAQMLYKVEDFSLSVYFDKDTASMDIYSRMPNVDGTHSSLSDADIEKLLKLEGIPSGTWYKVISKTGQKTWSRSDGKIIARFEPQHVSPTDGTAVYDIVVFVDAPHAAEAPHK